MRAICPYCAAPFESAPLRVAQTCRACGKDFESYLVARPEPEPPTAEAMVPGATPADAQPEARCARHPNSPARRSCARCGDYLCPVCVTPVGAHVLCVRCFEILDAGGELPGAQAAFRTPLFSFILGILSLVGFWINCLGFVGGPIAVILGLLSLREIRKKPALPGRGLAIAGIVFGSAAVLATIAFVVLYAWFIIAIAQGDMR